MKNLFDYATKELSQDAFLAWVFQNCEDAEIGDFSRRFISALISTDQKKIDPSKISNPNVKTQYKDVDVLLEFKIDGSDSVLVIEDKTNSNPHSNQLDKYKKIITNEYQGKECFFVYYKTNKVDENSDEYETITKAEWKLFDITEIEAFFKNEVENKNIIVRFYAEHVDDIYKKLTGISNKSMTEWDKVEGLSFFKSTVKPLFRKYHKGEKRCENDIYQGRYSSYRVYYTFSEKLKEKVYPLIEFIFRDNSENIILYAHISWRCGDDWSWKWKKAKSVFSLEERKKILKDICKIFAQCKFKERGDIDNDRTQTFATLRVSKKLSIQEVEKEIDNLLKNFVEKMDKYDKGNN